MITGSIHKVKSSVLVCAVRPLFDLLKNTSGSNLGTCTAGFARLLSLSAYQAYIQGTQARRYASQHVRTCVRAGLSTLPTSSTSSIHVQMAGYIVLSSVLEDEIFEACSSASGASGAGTVPESVNRVCQPQPCQGARIPHGQSVSFPSPVIRTASVSMICRRLPLWRCSPVPCIWS